MFRRQRELVCQQAVELVTDYIEGSMSRADRRRFEAHLSLVSALHGVPRSDAEHNSAHRTAQIRRVAIRSERRACGALHPVAHWLKLTTIVLPMSGYPGMIAPAGPVVRPDEDDGIGATTETVTTEVRVGRMIVGRCQDGAEWTGRPRRVTAHIGGIPFQISPIVHARPVS